MFWNTFHLLASLSISVFTLFCTLFLCCTCNVYLLSKLCLQNKCVFETYKENWKAKGEIEKKIGARFYVDYG